VSATPHPSADLELLYVGFAPEGPDSVCTSAVVSKNITAAQPAAPRCDCRWPAAYGSEKAGDRRTRAAQLSKTELIALQDWQWKHLSVQWVEAPHPLEIEPEVIAVMRPPLERDHNDTHPEYTRLGLARDSVRDESEDPPGAVQKAH